jgi:hypothetical protein
MFPGTEVILEDNTVRSGPAHGVGLASDEGKNIPEAIIKADH